MITKYIGIDPGVTTGLALWTPETSLRTTEFPSWHELHNWIKSALPIAVVVLEDFSGGRLNREIAETLKVIGQVRAFCYDNDIELVLRQPIARKPYERFLKQFELLPKSSRHAKDAAAHLIGWMIRQKQGPWA